jgi:hypothetical protein
MVSFQAKGELAHHLLVEGQGGVVPGQLVFAVLQGADDGVDHRVRLLKTGEIVLQRGADARQSAEGSRQPAGLEVEIAGIQLIHLSV